jgi:hypothetical protein
LPCAIIHTVYLCTLRASAGWFGIPFIPVTPLRFFMEYCAAFLTVDMIPHYLVKAVILEILVVSICCTALGAGMLTVS